MPPKKRARKHVCEYCHADFCRSEAYENHLDKCTLRLHKLAEAAKKEIPKPVHINSPVIEDDSDADDILELIKDELDEDEIEEQIEVNDEEDEDNEEESESDSDAPLNEKHFKLKDVIFPDHASLPEKTLEIAHKMERTLPYLFEGYGARIDSHKDLYLELMKRNNIANIGALPFMNYKITDKTALLTLTARDLSLTVMENVGRRKMKSDKPLTKTEINNVVAGLSGKIIDNGETDPFEVETIPIDDRRVMGNSCGRYDP